MQHSHQTRSNRLSKKNSHNKCELSKDFSLSEKLIRGEIKHLTCCTRLNLTYWQDKLKGGFPSPAEDYPVEKISLDKLLIKRPSSTFMIRVRGDSMINSGIYENDIAIIERGRMPQNGDIVIATIDGNFSMKFYRKKGTLIYLESAHKDLTKINETSEVEIFGIVSAIIRQIKEF